MLYLIISFNLALTNELASLALQSIDQMGHVYFKRLDPL